MCCNKVKELLFLFFCISVNALILSTEIYPLMDFRVCGLYTTIGSEKLCQDVGCEGTDISEH